MQLIFCALLIGYNAVYPAVPFTELYASFYVLFILGKERATQESELVYISLMK